MYCGWLRQVVAQGNGDFFAFFGTDGGTVEHAVYRPYSPLFWLAIRPCSRRQNACFEFKLSSASLCCHCNGKGSGAQGRGAGETGRHDKELPPCQSNCSHLHPPFRVRLISMWFQIGNLLTAGT